MSALEPDRLTRQMDLLKKMEGRGLARASDYFARQPESVAAGDTTESQKRTVFERLFNDAEKIEAKCGGVCRLIRTRMKLDGSRSREGYSCPVSPFGPPPTPGGLARLTGDQRWLGINPEKIYYLDTETTGLSTGSGTYTFLIGLGHFEGDQFTVEQYFMEDYGCEGAIVEAVDWAMRDAQALVSYNGRSFDVPLLEARWMMQRKRLRFPELHLDLLHYARRLWKLRLPNCSLGTVENKILGITRISDVDGSWVPRIYFDFVRDVHPERIVPVFDHHAQDIYSLAALTAAMQRAVEHPEDERFAHAADQFGLARIHELQGRVAEAIACMETAVLAARDEDLGFRMAMHLARTYKKHGRLDDALAIWQARAAQARHDRLDPLVELAKHAEHALKDYAEARRWAERALAVVSGHLDARALRAVLGDGDPLNSGQIELLHRRLTRIHLGEQRAAEKSAKKKTGRARSRGKNAGD